MIGGEGGGLEIESSDAQVPEEWGIEEAEKKADEQATRRALDTRAKWALRQMRRRERAEIHTRLYWCAKTVLNWIAFRKPNLIDVELLDAIPLYGNTGWSQFVERQPGRALLSALRSGSPIAIGSDRATVHAATWNHWSSPLDLNDHRAWAQFDFDREMVLKVFPVDQQLDGPLRPQAEAAIEMPERIVALEQSKVALPSFDQVRDFYKKRHAKVIADKGRTNREEAYPAAEAEFQMELPVKLLRDAYTAAEIRNKPGPRRNRTRKG